MQRPFAIGLVRRVPVPTTLMVVDYLLVVLGLPLLWVAAEFRWGADLRLVPHVALFTVFVVLTITDIHHSLLPDVVVKPSIAASVVAIVGVSVVEGSLDLSPVVAGALTFAGLLLIPHMVSPQGMGYGDVKLGLLAGMYVGWAAAGPMSAVYLVLVALLIGSGLGIVWGVLARLRVGRSVHFPFGPSLVAATIVCLLFSADLIGP